MHDRPIPGTVPIDPSQADSRRIRSPRVSAVQPVPERPTEKPTERPWWQGAVVYQIYPRSFCDTSGNGIGDLGGIRKHLDHLAWLGVDALWLSPIFPSPMADHGYDVADYCDIDPMFGSLEDFDRLLAEAHAAELRVLLDWVPNHTSEAHPWFVAARSSRRDPHRDWYLWVEGTPDEPPNAWRAMFPRGPAWTWDETSGSWYYHRFTPQQPDLNWGNPEVRKAMHDTLRFWLDRGVDGFRMDVIHAIGKDPSLIHAPVGDGPTDPARTHAHLRDIRALIDSYPGDRVAVGEVYILDVEKAATYVGRGPDGDELHLGFNFVPLFLPWEAGTWRSHLDTATRAYGEREAWPTWVLSSHDIPRQRTRLGSDARARAAALLLLGLRGTPFLYAGEDLGLEDAEVPPEQAEDPAGFRDGCRAPIPWEGPPDYGWAPGSTPWLPWPPHADRRNRERLAADEGSILHLYRRALAARRASSALRVGEQDVLRPAPGDPDDEVLAWWRRAPDDQRLVAVNVADEPRVFDPATTAAGGGWHVELASDGAGEGAVFRGELGPSQAVFLRPAH
jgi:alpha-glucosidase